MKFWILLLMVTISCTSSKNSIDQSTEVTVAKGFIQSLFQGKFDRAELYLDQTPESKGCLKKYRFQYNQMITKEKKEKYKVASIIIEKEIVSDSISIIKYKDPVAKTSPTPLKIIRTGKQWVIDFSYSCSGNL